MLRWMPRRISLDRLNPAVEEFDREIGVGYLRGMHLNDSKAALGSKKDRHENIGLYVP